VPDQLALAEPWWDLRVAGDAEERQKAVIDRELRREIGAGHPLAGQPLEIIAAFVASDDVLVRFADDHWAIVHLTWAEHRERPEYPLTEILIGGSAVQAAVDDLTARSGF
jgi:hypothetical protein